MINAVYFYSFSEIMQVQGKITHYQELFEDKRITPNSSFGELQKKLIPIFESLELNEKDIILAVSGWADSMMVASQILYFYWKNNLDLSKIHIAHCNHKIRLESEDEAKFMSDFFSGLDFHLSERDTSLPEDESSLRNRRYSQFSSLQKLTKSSYIFVGHHLNDRIESTFLNLMRWSWISGFVNMHKVEEHHLLPEWCKVCRLLLDTPKSDILDICETAWIPYFEDKTNLDNSISKRNWLRNEILKPLSEDSRFIESFSNVYTQIENFEKKGNLELIETSSFSIWNAKYSYVFNKDILKFDENDLFELFKYLRLQVSSLMIEERKEWMNRWQNGYKYIGWVYFFIHEKQLYIIKADKEFWKHKSDVEVEVKSIEDIEFLWLKLDISREQLIWSIVRLPKEWDSFAWKSWNRRALNQKIPMRWRNSIPLAIKDGKVIHMWKNVWK